MKITDSTAILLALSTTGLLASSPASAYELWTHARITYKSYENSALGKDQSLPKNLGIDSLITSNPDNPFGMSYYDLGGSTITVRTKTSFEKAIMDDSNNPNPVIPISATDLSLPGWLMRGAIREDDVASAFGIWVAKNPKSDQDSPHAFWRVVNHFFDPYYNRPLTFAPEDATLFELATGESNFRVAPTWALGVFDAFAATPTPDSARRNHYSVEDARESLYRALTGKKQDGTNADPGVSDNNPASEAVRKKYWATTFRALGDVLHLNQDMAQPQHTRNDPHSGVPGYGHESAYEKYIDARARGDHTYKIDGTPVLLDALSYGTYPIPTFSRYSDFWSTSPGANAAGDGLADYSNRSFFTAGTNLGSNSYPLPSNNVGDYTPENAAGLSAWPLQKFKFLRGGPDNIRMTTESIFDFYLSSSPATYTLNRFNYDDMAQVLIPRAVAYSAGLINHFFRGRMKIELPDEGVYGLVDHSTIQITDPLANFTGFEKIKLRLSNITPNNEAMSGGTVIAVLKFRRNIRYVDDLTGYPPFIDGSTCEPPSSDGHTCRTQEEEIVVSNPANGGATVALDSTPQSFTFTFPKALPINATDVRLQVVYRGMLGEEADAVVVATQDISEPAFFSYINASDYIRLNGYVYTRDQINADQTLLAQVRPETCIDTATMQLKATCLNSIDVTLGLTVGSNGKQTQIDTQISLRRFMRIAFLGDAATRVSFSQKSTNNCVPFDAFEVDPSKWQDYVDLPSYTAPTFQKIRNVSTLYGASCVLIGDGGPAGSPDNRNEVMTPIDIVPDAVEVNAGAGF